MQKTIALLEHPTTLNRVRFTELPGDLVRETLTLGDIQDINVVFNNAPIHGRPSVVANKLATYFRAGYITI
jgi:hypothetical protein